MHRHLVFLALAVVGLVGCGGSSTSDGAAEPAAPESTSTSDPTATPTPKPRAQLIVHDRTVHADDVELAGRVRPPRAEVRIDHKPVEVDKRGRFALPVTVEQGRNRYFVSASSKGYQRASTFAVITRTLSAEEKAAVAAQEEAEFKAAATTVDYDQLEKNPDDYRGTKVVYTGQIFQIQESYGATWMLLSVTDEGYGFWDDNIWVNYDGEIDGAEEDIITVYGTVRGSQSYQTQIGGETYVPKVKAEYVEE
jgi:hypothetical protein